MELRHYLSILRKRILLLLLAPLLTAVIGYSVSQRMEPVYQASTTVLISPASNSESPDYSLLLMVERIGNTYAKLLTGRPLMEEVISNLNLKLTSDQLAGKISVTQPVNTQLLVIRVEDSDPSLAVAIANDLAETFHSQYSQRKIGNLIDVEIVEPAALPARLVRPRPVMNTAVAALAGIVLGLGFVFLLDYLDVTISQAEDAERVLRVPTLASIPTARGSTPLRPNYIIDFSPTSPFSEAYRMLRTNILLSNLNEKIHKSILISSALAGEGKSTAAVNLGIVMAQAGVRVLLVDTDLRRSSLHHFFDLPNHGGLSDLLQVDGEPIESYILETPVPNLILLPGGKTPERPSELLSSGRMARLMSQLNSRAEILIFDSPPILSVTDAVLLSSRVDGVLLVIEARHTPSEAAKRALIGLQTVNAHVVGSILNRYSSFTDSYYNYRRLYDLKPGKLAGLRRSLTSAILSNRLVRSPTPDESKDSKPLP